MRRKTLLFYFLVMVTFMSSLQEVDAQIFFPDLPEKPKNKPCTSPNGLDGECVNILECKPVLQLLRRQPIPKPTITFLRQSVCEIKDGLPVICCVRARPLEDTPTKPSVE